MKPKESLYIKWKQVRKNVREKGGVCDWETFDEFYVANRGRYYRAVRKWRNYKPYTGKGKVTYIIFIRKDKSKGYTVKNTVFTSASDRMKYHSTGKKYYLDGRVLGTRDMSNLIRKRTGVKLTSQDIINRVKKNKLLFAPTRLKNFLWRGKWVSLTEIADKEGISYTQICNLVKLGDGGEDLKKAVEYCKNNPPEPVVFEGKEMPLKEALTILAERHGVSFGAMNHRYYKYGKDFSKIAWTKSDNPLAPYPKNVSLEKDGEKLFFPSISEAAKFLKYGTGNVSRYANGLRKGRLRGYKILIEST